MIFSIGIPAFKGVFLSECLDSIINQTYDNFEIIIVNDASPDNIYDIVHEKNDKRIKYFENEKNFGVENVIDNWNKCLYLASGDYFILMGDDDLLAKNYLDEFAFRIRQHPEFKVYHCRSKIVNEQNEVIQLTPSLPVVENIFDLIWARMCGFRLQFISDFVYQRKELIENGGFVKLPCAWYSDDLTAFRACGKVGIYNINEPLFSYRRSSFTISAKGDVKLKLKASVLAQNWLEGYISNSLHDSNDYMKAFINLNLEKWFQNKKIGLILHSIKNKNVFHRIILLFKYKKYFISLKGLLIVFILSIQKIHESK